METTGGLWAKNLTSSNSGITAKSGDITITGPEINLSVSLLTARSGDLSLSGETSARNSVISASGDINLAGIIDDRDTNTLTINAGRDITGQAIIRAGEIKAAGTISAASATAKRLSANAAYIAGELAINKGLLSLASASQAGAFSLKSSGFALDSLKISGNGSFLDSFGSFESLETARDLNFTGGEIKGRNLSAGNIFAGGNNRTILSVANLDGSSYLVSGSRAFVTLGSGDPVWVRSWGDRYRLDNGALGVTEPVRFAASGGLDLNPGLKSKSSGHSHDLNFANGSNFVVNGERAWEGHSETGLISSDSPKDVFVAPGAKLFISGVTSNKLYIVLGDNIRTLYADNSAWDGANLQTDHQMIGVQKVEGRDGSFHTFAKEAE
ncbi:MAG: DUF4097 domain-containing protein, partial [Desulfovibrio sp.]|nr:DUF4097 domain-containing protein [Desulfovibrio sp.]